MTGALSPCPDLACTLPWGSPLGGKGLRGWAGLLGSSLPRSRGDLPPGVLSNVPSHSWFLGPLALWTVAMGRGAQRRRPGHGSQPDSGHWSSLGLVPAPRPHGGPVCAP